jgi:hypothetical protein
MTDPTKTIDDVDAIRSILETLGKLPSEDQRRVLSYVQDKLGVVPSTAKAVHTDEVPTVASSKPDIRSFIQTKNPTNDVQFAAAVAYFYAFEAPTGAGKPEINASDLQDATRMANRPRLTEPRNTLNNANRLGYLDRGTSRGMFRINTVGENLVAMALPATNAVAAPSRKKNRPKTTAKHK